METSSFGPDDEKAAGFARFLTGNPEAVKRLAGDASSRRYWRVWGKNGTAVVCHDPGLRGPDHPFIIIRNIFSSQGIPVPEIHDSDFHERLLLLQDVGDLSLEAVVSEGSPEAIENRYVEAMELVLRVQKITAPYIVTRKGFDREKLGAEFFFFLEHFVGNLMGIPLEDKRTRILREVFAATALRLDRPGEFVTCHRDFHSRNLYLFNGLLYMIDFQDACPGLPVYDMVSLLRDAYSVLDEPLRVRLDNRCHAMLRGSGATGISEDEFILLRDRSAFQRIVKALGSFAYFSTKGGKEKFSAWIVPALAYLDEIGRRDKDLAAAIEVITAMYRERSAR